MNVRLGTFGFVYICDCCSGKDYDRQILRNCRFSVVWEEARVRVAEGVIVAVGIIDWERCILWIQAGGCNRCRGSRGGEITGYDGQGEQGYVVFLRQANRGGGGGEGGPKSAVEGCEGYAEIDSIVFNGRLDGVGFKNCVLIVASQLRGRFVEGGEARLTIARTLDRSQAIFHVRRVEGRRTYAQT